VCVRIRGKGSEWHFGHLRCPINFASDTRFVSVPSGDNFPGRSVLPCSFCGEFGLAAGVDNRIGVRLLSFACKFALVSNFFVLYFFPLLKQNSF